MIIRLLIFPFSSDILCLVSGLSLSAAPYGRAVFQLGQGTSVIHKVGRYASAHVWMREFHLRPPTLPSANASERFMQPPGPIIDYAGREERC